MKKFFLSLVLGLSVLTQSFASDGGKINPRLVKSLEKQFAGAQSVHWESITKENLYHARFVYNNERLSAFFEANGNILAVGRYIDVKSLPLLISQRINNQYPKHSIQDVIEYTTEGETSYVISIDNEKERVVLRAYNNGTSYVFKKAKKNTDKL
jgi:hypothetical protein